MVVFSKRNAFVGWLVISLAKPVAKQKAAMAARRAKSKRGGIVAASVAAAGAGLVFWKKHRADDTAPDEPSES